MPLSCTCGAILPEDARFCHKCGKPQYEEDIARLSALEEQPAVPAPIAQQPLPAVPPSLTNGRAVRITLVVAAISLLAIAVTASIAPMLVVPLFIAVGFTAVRVYLSRTKETLKPGSAALIGAMPWLWLFLLQALCTAFLILTPQSREIAKAFNNPEFTQLLDDPAKQVVQLLLFLLVGTAAGALGGILAVRWQPRNGPSH